MSANSGAGFSKDPCMPSHGDSLVDQSFQSLKAKEVRDSSSPTHDIKFHSLALNQPNTGWDVRSSSEVSPDGRAFRSETVATTDGKEKLNGGVAEFKGRNEQRSSASHQGDDKNFVKKASESSNTHLQEKVVIGDENSGRTEVKKSSTTTSSSSQVFSSSSTTQHDDGMPIGQKQQKYLTDDSNRQYEQQHHQQQQQQQRLQEEHNRQQHEEERRTSTSQRQSTQQEQHSETYNQSRQNTSQNVETQRHHEESKRYVDMDKASPEYQRQVQYLMSQPGEILSNTVEYPKPNVKMITTVKRLPDGTIVKNKRYETEELSPSSERIQQRTSTTSTNATNQHSAQRRVEEENLQSRLKNSRERTTTTNTRQISPQRPNVDAVDNARYTQDRQHQLINKDDVTNETSSSTFSTVKKSSRRFSTETTSETIEEVDDRTLGQGKPQDFSTHGFPSVKPNKPTQEFPSERPHAAQPGNDYSTQGFPSVKPHKPTQQYPTDRPSPVRSTAVDHATQRVVSDSNSPNVRKIKTPDGEVIVVSNETQRTVKHKTNAERIVETEVVSDVGAGPKPHSPQKITHVDTHHHHMTEDFSTHGFPSVKESSPVWDDQPRHGAPTHENPRQTQPKEDFTTHGFPSVKETSPIDKPRPVAPTHEHLRQQHPREDFTTHGFPSVKENSPVWDDMPRHGTPTRDHESPVKSVQPYTTNEAHHTTVSSETKRTSSHQTNAERIIEVVTDREHTGYGQPENDFSTHGFPSVRDSKKTRDISPVHTTPVRDRPISPRRHDDYSTHGFPSARSPTRAKPFDHSNKPKPRTQSPQRKVTSTTSTRRPTTSSTTTTDSRTSLRKQHDVDATHRRFAASLRSTSPVDHHRRDSHDSHHPKLTPRSSVSSQATTRTFRRDQREGSHDSAAPSETSRISSSTVTRQSPGKTVGKTVVTTKQTVVKTRNVHGSNDKIDLTPQRTTTIKTKSPSPGKSVTTTTTTITKSSQPRSPKTPIAPTKSTPTSPTKITPTTPTKSTPSSPTKSTAPTTPITKPTSQDTPKTAKTPSTTYSPTAPNSHVRTHRTSQQQEHHVIKKDSPEREYAPIRYTSENDMINEPLQPTEKSSPKNPKFDNEVRKTVPKETTFEKTEQQNNQPKKRTEPVTSGDEPQYDSDEPSVTSDFEPYQRNDKPQKLSKEKPIHTTENERVEQLFNVKVTKGVKQNVNEKFIDTERDELVKNVDESPDGAFISKEPTNSQPTTPTFRKKGLSRRETFEERCRQILGMEDNGDTQGTFKPMPDKDNENPKDPTSKPEVEFVVKIEDCDDSEDDKPMSINTVRETLTVKTENKPKRSTSLVESEIDTESYPESEVDSVKENFVTEKVIECNNISKKSPAKIPKSKTPTVTTSKEKVTPKTTQKATYENHSPKSTTLNSNTTVKTTAKHTITPKPVSESPKTRPTSSTKVVETLKETVTSRKNKSFETPEPTIKDRLRSATRKSPSKPKTDERDGSLSSSSEPSPTRLTERRRSSNISVHTEIIIDHAGSKSPERETPTMKRKNTQPSSPKKPTSKDAPETLYNRKLPVTERKESAPVNRVTRREDDIKMSRSTSENIIKVNGQTKPTTTTNKKPAEPSTLSPKRESRPNKCFTTKTINLTTNDRFIQSDNTENVIIDIQQAKSSREPSPDKIVPTPVPADMDTGKPRYPDIVQEPEDEPRRKPVIKNIPILEEDTNVYINCHISEVKVDKTNSSIIDNTDYNDEILTQPTIEAPKSLDYPSIDKPDEECLLSVHEKVSKFINTAEETNKPKSSSPFNPSYEKIPQVPEDDECLLTVDEKVTKFLQTAESITKTPITPQLDIERPNIEDLDEEIRNDECTLSVSEKVNKFISTAKKLAPSTPQKAPELVARIERHISRQSEPDDEESQPALEPFSENHTVELELKRQKDILTRPSVWDKNGPRHPVSNKPRPQDDEELVPMTKTHTTEIEIRRQKDILTRPSVFEDRKTTPTKPQSPAPTKKFQDNNKQFTSSTTVNTTRSRFETPKASPGKEPTSNTVKPQTPKGNGTTPSSQTKPTCNINTKTSIVTNGKSTSPMPTKRTSVNEGPMTDETESEIEFIETEQSVSRKSSTQSTKTIEKNQAQPNSPREVSHSPARYRPSSSRSSSPKKSTTTVTASSVNKCTYKTHPDTSSKTTTETVLNESIIETSPRESTPLSTKKPKTTTESVAARRNIFEKTATQPVSSIDDRRPSYMDHTRSSLEHIRRDSLEVNKTHYARKPSVDDELPARPNTTVKFDVPKKVRQHESISEEINIEEIFDLEMLEEMLETVTSYDLRRRIRAQIRLIKKNALNTTQTDSKTISSSMHKSSMHTSSSSKSHNHQHHHRHEESDISHAQKPYASNRSHSPQGHGNDAYKKPRDRSHSPCIDEKVHHTSESTTSKHFKRTEQVDFAHKNERAHSRQEVHEVHHSPERTSVSPSSKPPVKPRDRSLSPDMPKLKPSTERSSPVPKPRDRSHSPQQKSSAGFEEKRTSVTKTTVRTTRSPERRTSKPRTDDKTPIWADRKNILKSPGNQSPVPSRKAPSSPVTRASATKTTKSSASQRQVKTNEEDCITSSYGIGPTDENGLPLFGIKALKKKSSKPIVDPCETNEEVTGYVIEEQWYSDGTKVPKHERKEFIYSTNDEDLKSMKKQVESRKYSKDDANVTRKFQKIDKEALHKQPQAMMSGNVEDLTTATNKKYVRRGSVKEMSEKFIRKESAQSISESSATKSGGYPKAGLILRTNSRKGSIGANEHDDDDLMSTMTTTSTTTKSTLKKQQQPTTSKTTTTTKRTMMEHDDYDDFESAHAHENYEQSEHAEEQQSSSTRSFHESESECESLSTKREFVNKKSSSSMSSSTRSFLNTTGESRVVTDVDDVLERMRNADNVVEEGDTAEDREARALLNKFLGASVIMRGVETGSLACSPQTKQETKTTTSTRYNDDGDKVTTTRVTKTIKSSGSSSTPVTYKTCDIEEIWDEEILKQLLESATTYEERRKIRARLRELMAEREAQQLPEQHGGDSKSTVEKTETKEKDDAVVTTTTKVTTRTVTGGTAPKPVSAFTKFKQLDRQNSQPSQKMSK